MGPKFVTISKSPICDLEYAHLDFKPCTYRCATVNGNVLPVQATKEYKGSGGTAPLILTFDTRCKWSG